jgi:hypothetical protein
MNKSMKKINIPDDSTNDAANIMSKLSGEASKLPSLSKKGNGEETNKGTIITRSSKSMSFPDYVWEQIRSRSFEDKMPMNVFLLHALKKYGLEINEADLVDGRTIR